MIAGETCSAVYDLRGVPFQARDLLPDGRVRHAAPRPGRDGNHARRFGLLPAEGIRAEHRDRVDQGTEHRQERNHRLCFLNHEV